MDEARWRSARNSMFMLSHLRRTPPGLRTKHRRRVFRLFGCACVRRVPALLDDPTIAKLFTLSEQFAEGTIDAAKLDQTRREVYRKLQLQFWRRKDWPLIAALVDPKAWNAARAWRVTAHARYDTVRATKSAKEKAAQASLVRCLFGDPFRPVTGDRAWRNSTTIGLCQGIYADRAFDRLPILADALEESGCEDPAVLAHCRGPGPHDRGCHVVDWVLGQ